MGKNIVLMLAVLAISLLVAEAVMRARGFAPRVIVANQYFTANSETTWSIPDAELGWVNKAGVSRSLEAGNAPMTFWDFGRRASRPDPTPPANALPVMIVGASDAQSYGVRDQDTFAYRLAQRFPTLWIENFGTGGYSTVQSELLAERAFAQFYGETKPRLIILTFGAAYLPRDVADQSWIFAISDTEGRYVAPPHFRMNDGELKFHPFRTIGFWPLEARSAALTTAHNMWLKSVAYNTGKQAPLVTRRVLGKFAAFASAHHALLAVVTLLDANSDVQSVLKDQPFPTKDCSGLEHTDPQHYLLGGTSHPNAALHAVFSDCIGAWLEGDLLPRVDAAPSPPRTARAAP